MRSKVPLAVVLTVATSLMSCSKGGSGGGDAGPTAPSPPNPGTQTSQNGCSVTYACPNVDINGAANPATPTFATLALSNGTSATCRASAHRNTPDPGIAIEFTIRNPAQGFIWRNKSITGDQTVVSISSPGQQGGALSTAPIQATAQFAGVANTRTGLNFSQNLVLEIASGQAPPGGTAVASCGVTVFGTFPSGL